MEKKIFFLNPPSYEGFDGGAGSRYQARREIKSFWYPTWLAQAAALCPGSRVLDAPADEIDVAKTVEMAKGYDVAVIYTSTPGYVNDAKIAQQLKAAYPSIIIGMVGPHTTALPEKSLEGCKALDFVARGEFDYTIADIAKGVLLEDILGLSYIKNGSIINNADRPTIEDMDMLPSVLDVYKRDLNIENYFIGYLLHPYLSVYTGRGCTSRCTFCLWPQTIGGHEYRRRSVKSVIEEIARAKEMFPQVKEFFFDDDTFTADAKRAEEIARGLKTSGVTWSSSARVTVQKETLQVMKDGGLRCLMVGIESGDDGILKHIKKGINTDQALKFMKACKELKIATHATFTLGLPGETKDTIKQTIEFAKRLDPNTIQVSIATPYPGTEFYREAMDKGWFVESNLVSDSGLQQVCITYDGLSSKEIFDSVETFYNKFYFRPKPILRILGTMIKDGDIRKRRLREASEFFTFMKKRKQSH